ncbi:hypothetical protein MPER_13164 [Moniliophthora perniciosa FA553]|nr:hypothetical protein MPER_13164 [Moniliophthora perniciosa FA553]
MLDGSTYDPQYESELDTDNDDLWSSAHDSDVESANYSFNDHMGYEKKAFTLSDLVAIKRERSPALPTPQDPEENEPEGSKRVRTPFSTPPPKFRLSDTALRALAKAVPFHQDAALITGGASLLSMRSSEGLISPPRGMVTFTDSYCHYCHRRDVFGPPVPQPRRFTAEEKGKGKATFEPPPAPVAKTVLPTPAKIDNAAAAGASSQTVEAYTTDKFFNGSITRGGITRYEGRKQGKKGENEEQDSMLVIKTSGHGVKASTITKTYHELNNVNTLSVCLFCAMIPGGYACRFEAGSPEELQKLWTAL